MIKPLSETDKKKIFELLQGNIISKIQNQKTKKPKSIKFITTDNFNKNNKQISYRNRVHLTYNSFSQNNSNKNSNKTSRKIIYKPRRLVKLEGGDIPLRSIGKATLDYTKTYYKMEADDFDKKLCSTGRANKDSKPLETEVININNQAEFKAASAVKFTQSSGNLYKLKKNIDLISENRKRNYDDLFSKMIKLLEIQSQLFLSDEIEEQNNIYLKTASTHKTLSNQNSNTLNHKSLPFENNNKKNIPYKMRKVINLCLEIGSTVFKFLTLIFTELREKHDENILLLKKSNEQEIHINQMTKELESLQKYQNKDINSRKYFQKGKDNSINYIKKNFQRKENEYILNIYQLEDEIRNLTILLNKNKDYYNKLKETEKEIEKNKRRNEELRSLYNKEIHQKIIENANDKDREEELNNKIIELEEIIDKLKGDHEVNKRKEIESNAKIKKIKMIVNEKIENIRMLNEELEWYIREYEKEKFNHNNTKTALQILEKRIFKDDDKIDELKEKNKVIGLNNNKNNFEKKISFNISDESN